METANKTHCEKCGLPLTSKDSPFDPNVIHLTCVCPPNFTQRGWVCPLCNCGINPNSLRCPCNTSSLYGL